jgi:SAM-dependent methyltransferase
VVFSNGVLHHTPDITSAFREAQRVLKPGGEFWVLLYHRDSIFHWLTLGLFDHVLRAGFRQRAFRERLAMIENPGVTDALPLVHVYSRGQVRRLLHEFVDVRTSVRKLTPEDLPRLPKLGQRLWERVPQAALDRVGRLVGWYIVARAVKP